MDWALESSNIRFCCTLLLCFFASVDESLYFFSCYSSYWRCIPRLCYFWRLLLVYDLAVVKENISIYYSHIPRARTHTQKLHLQKRFIQQKSPHFIGNIIKRLNLLNFVVHQKSLHFIGTIIKRLNLLNFVIINLQYKINNLLFKVNTIQKYVLKIIKS